MNHYKIPYNFKDSGYILNGQVAVRNAIDAVLMALLGIVIACLIPVKGYGKLSLFILLAGLFGVAGLIGVRGVPLSTFVLDFIHWRKRKKKPFLYNNHGETFTQSAADVALDTPALRDMVADVADTIKARFTEEKNEYIEGVTFEFTPDPELEALRYAEQAKEELAREEQTTKANTQPQASPAAQNNAAEQFEATTPTSISLDAESIIEQIVLN